MDDACLFVEREEWKEQGASRFNRSVKKARRVTLFPLLEGLSEKPGAVRTARGRQVDCMDVNLSHLCELNFQTSSTG